MSGDPVRRHRRAHLKPVAWFALGLLVLVGIGFAIGSNALWIAALVVFLLLVMGAIAIPRNVHDLNVPPGMTNAPGDVTEDERESWD
jgi:hypothetical protein